MLQKGEGVSQGSVWRMGDTRSNVDNLGYRCAIFCGDPAVQVMSSQALLAEKEGTPREQTAIGPAQTRDPAL